MINVVEMLTPIFTNNKSHSYLWREYHVCKEGFKDTEGVIRIRKSKKNRQHNDQKKNYKRTNNDLQSIHIKLKIG